MHLDPTLPIEMVPVTGSKTIDSNLSAGMGDALLSMTYVAAKKSQTGSIPPMRLHSVNYFSGFMLLTRAQDGVTSIDDLLGKNILISGPIGSGQNGGPDIFFQAYLAQEGLTVSDFSMHYLPLNDGVAAVMNQTPLDDGDDDPSDDSPADAFLLVEPAATGMVMNTQMSDTPMEKGINTQLSFAPKGSWSQYELPLGGFSIIRAVSDDTANADLIERVIEAYSRAAEILMTSSKIKQLQYANVIADGITKYYGQYDIAVPGPVIVVALDNGGLVYRYDVDLDAIYADLDTFLEMVIGIEVDTAFYALPVQ